MYNEQLEQLIDATLADGILTEKEKQVLFKKAEAKGIDLDEFEVLLDARLYQRTQEMQRQAAPVPSEQSAPQSNKFGDVMKCPACGAIVPSFSTTCPDCGYQFKGIEASKTSRKFFDCLNELEMSRSEDIHIHYEAANNSGCSLIFIWLFFWWIMIPVKCFKLIFNQTKLKWSTTDRRKEELIVNFPVPASVEDIIEFITLSKSKIKSITFVELFNSSGSYTLAWNKIWLGKINQIIDKAKLSMTNDKKQLENIMQLAAEAKAIQDSNLKKKRIMRIFIAVIVAFVALIPFIPIILANVSSLMYW